MLLSLQGEEGTGKSTLAYTAPLPIIGLQFDLGADRAIYGGMWELFKDLDICFIDNGDELKGEHDITIYNLPRAIQIADVMVGVREQWKKAQGIITKIPNSRIASLVIDTATLARKLAADAYLQELQETEKGKARKQLIQIEYGHPNQDIADVYSLFKGMGKNLITTHHLTDERLSMPNKDGLVESMITGKRIMEGYNKTPQLVDVIVETSVVKNKVVGEFKKCGYNLSLVGTKLDNPTWDTIVNMITMSLGGRLQLPLRNTNASTK